MSKGNGWGTSKTPSKQRRDERFSLPRWMLVWVESGRVEHISARTAVEAAEKDAVRGLHLVSSRPEGEATAIRFRSDSGRKKDEVFVYPAPKTWPITPHRSAA